MDILLNHFNKDIKYEIDQIKNNFPIFKKN